MIKSNLVHYSDTYILVKGTIIILNAAAAALAVNNTNENLKTVLHLLTA